MVYRVLADGIDIFGSDTESSLLSPSLELELNSAGSLEFMLPPDHPSYDDISLMQTEIDVYEDDDLIFFGRPAEVGIDWNKQKKIVCEGALAYLNDAAIRPHKFEGALISDVFKYIIAQYNAQVAQNKQFIVGNITITDRYVYTEFDYDICLSVLISTCIDSTGGYLFLRKEDNGIYIDWLAEVPDVSDQPVQFASNMLDLNQDTRAEDICTVVLPVGGQVDGVNITIASVNQGSDILEDSDAITKYGRILKIQQWNDIIDPQALKEKATEWLAKQQEDDITIETDAAELHYLDGSVGAYRIGQMVDVISGPHGVNKEYPILKMSMSLDSGTKKITLGTPPRKELTELSGITNSTGGSGSSSGGGGGTEVEANPSEPATDDLETIKIGNTVYDIPGSGGSGGMIMMSDYYSEDEQVVGRWIDGKPLYQKVLTIPNLPNATSADYPHGIQNVDNIWVSDGVAKNTQTGSSCQLNNTASNNVYQWVTNADRTNVSIWAGTDRRAFDYVKVILKYTKTTDAPGTGPTKGNLIYLPALYSEEEREVGVWTDGRPLYQKTFHVNELANNSTKSIAHNISDIDIANMGEAKGVIKHTSGYAISIPKVSDNSTNFQIFFEITDTNIIIYSRNLDGRNFSGQITLQYTKTTDQPGSGTWTPEGQLAHHYSTSEHIVGTWIDGSTVYERTWDFGSDIAIQSQSWVDTSIKMSDYNIDFCTSVVSAINNDKNCAWDFISVNTDTNASQYVRLWSTRSVNCNVRYLTLQYTKTS